MTTYLAVQLIFCAAYAMEATYLVWRYHVTISRPLQLRSLQQRLFALRDELIYLVAEGKFKEDDTDWQALYKVVNDSAKATSIDQFRSGSALALRALHDALPPSKAERDRFPTFPVALQVLWLHYVLAVLKIVTESWRFRTILALARHWSLVKKWLERARPKEVKRYREWLESANEFERQGKPPKSNTPAGVAAC